MTGQDLHEMYERERVKQQSERIPLLWHEISDIEKVTWGKLAQQVEETNKQPLVSRGIAAGWQQAVGHSIPPPALEKITEEVMREVGR